MAISDNDYFHKEHIFTLKRRDEETGEEKDVPVKKKGYIIPFIDSNICMVEYEEVLDTEYFKTDAKVQKVVEVMVYHRSGSVPLENDEAKEFLEDFTKWLEGKR